MTDRIPLAQHTKATLDALYDELDALQQIARGYCPACGRGDAAPTIDDWQQQRKRADQAEELLRIAHDTSNKSEAERALAVQRAERAEAALARVREAARWIRRNYPGLTHVNDQLTAALDEPTPAATQATDTT
jgi:RNA 3'-terminal phosphate cyclase